MRSHHFGLIHNPHAVVPLGSEIMKGYPQFTKTAENATSTTYSWIDEQSDLLVDDQRVAKSCRRRKQTINC